MKKVMMKRVTIALVIVCAILAFFALGFYSYSIEMTNKYDSLVDEYNEVIDEYNQLVDGYNQVLENIEDYVKLVDEILENYSTLLEQSYIENENVIMSFHTSNLILHQWAVPLKTLGSQIYLSWYKKETSDFEYLNLRDNETGEIHHVIDFKPFVIENNFATVIPILYRDLGNNDQALVYEVWYVVTQLTTYKSEITETPKFPLQTLITGGGDCEDLAILIASMLKAAPANYVVKLVYMDSDNPTDPENINHVTVWVETPSGYKTFVDGTSKTVMSPFTLVDGWYLEV